ncbi:hypothetical protein ABZT43_45270 [Streptomyces sp. NPDC005349]|uniref:PepSY domain-containing protein n=1 Tax=Streptomyces sp. NPDC005349 TaxID=3157037 RepID=UPI0033AFD560
MKDLEQDKARQIHETGHVKTLAELAEIASERHPGGPGTLGSSYGEDEEKPDRYVATVDVKDGNGVLWAVELDAVTGGFIAETTSKD